MQCKKKKNNVGQLSRAVVPLGVRRVAPSAISPTYLHNLSQLDWMVHSGNSPTPCAVLLQTAWNIMHSLCSVTLLVIGEDGKEYCNLHKTSTF